MDLTVGIGLIELLIAFILGRVVGDWIYDRFLAKHISEYKPTSEEIWEHVRKNKLHPKDPKLTIKYRKPQKRGKG